MKIFYLYDKARASESGEYILGSEDTGSHACYMIKGFLKPGDSKRLIKPGKGHEEIVLVMKGDIEVSGHYSGTIKEGCAFHIAGDDECFLENKNEHEVIYIVAGGHSEGGHH